MQKFFLSLLALIPLSLCAAEPPVPLELAVQEMGKPISSDLFGIFFEDINYAADGGLYGELIQNRSFEYQATEQPTWNQFTAWQFVERGGAKGLWMLEETQPIHPNNPHYLILRVNEPGEGVGVANEGFDGIPIRQGETYDFSFFARQLYMNGGPGPSISIEGKPMPVAVRLESKDGALLGEANTLVEGYGWKKSTATITPSKSDENARLVLLAKAKGGIALDEISLFPRKTFHGHPNGLRPDLAQAIADLHPKFIRFPGGCVAHGKGLSNIYRWKETIGPVEQRRGQKNFWGYHQSVGLGYFEYFQFCEDIGAKPLPVLAAGVCCQFSDQMRGLGQQAIPMEQMPGYIQDILDLFEWANGPATSQWGSKRAAAGHPEPFHLQYIGIGNEDKITPEFKTRFKMIQEAIRAKHPEIEVIGTVGTQPDGEDFTEGWKFAKAERVPMVDEHYYRPPQWFLENMSRYDDYDRSQTKVYVGEYAAQEKNRHSTLRSALAEAAFLTSLERNGDVVRLSSYAPLLARKEHTQWTPDLIYFTKTAVNPTVNYYVQQLFCSNSGDTYYPIRTGGLLNGSELAFSAVKNSESGDFILKIVNNSAAGKALKIDTAGRKSQRAILTVLAGDAMAENRDSKPLVPATKTISVGSDFEYEAPANSLTVLRLPSEKL